MRPGSKVIGASADVREPEQLVAAVAKTVAELGRIDFVIAGAAGNFLSAIEHLSPNAFKQVVSIDLLGSYNTLKACLPELKKNKGRIIFVSATLHYSGTLYQAHAVSAKAGVDALSNMVALEFGPLGINSNVIAPGPIDGTEGMTRLLPKELEPQAKANIPLGRYGLIKEIADATVFLFSDAANYITGTTVVVDGAEWRRGSSFLDYPSMVIEPVDMSSVVKGGKKNKNNAKI